MTLACLCSYLLAPSLFAAYSLPESEIAEIRSKYGEMTLKRVNSLIKLMNSLEKASEVQKIKKINSFFNKVAYDFDENIWGIEDYWATRNEFLWKGKGDCEDYVIAKYFSLLQLGVPDKKMFLSYVKAVKFNRAHMVLTYFVKPKTTPLVLDNYNLKILPATHRKDLIPVYSFNGSSLYIAKQRGLGKAVPGGNQKNTKWLELLQKIKKEK